jgi:hypothetical protein
MKMGKVKEEILFQHLPHQLFLQNFQNLLLTLEFAGKKNYYKQLLNEF